MGTPSARLRNDLQKFKHALFSKFNVTRIILFGSQISGNAGQGSDVDLVVVSPIFKRNRHKHEVEMYHEWHIVQKIDFPVDLMCYTPQEYQRLKGRVSIVSEALKNGIGV